MTRENKFGMFIHWGLYALTGVHEQAFARLDIPREEYENLIHSFNPVKYDPEAWVKAAKDVGMKYICFTAKHHDGFCMWDTKQTDYSIMNTPYGRDVLRMLADACAKHGMLLSLYYSNPDWHHEYGYNSKSSHQWKCVQKEREDTEAYRRYVKAQIRELLTNYGPIYTMFWDIPPQIYDPSLNELVRSLQPGILINDRGWDKGDFSTPEREYEAPGGTRFTRMTEACNSLGQQSWGYREGEDFYSLRHMTSSIDRIMSMGGSYLLNVGPTAEGEIAPEYARRLRRVGDWYTRMEGCLECAESDPFDYCPRDSSCIATVKGGKKYLHFPDGLISSAVNLEKYPSLPRRVRLMNTGENLAFGADFLPEYFDGETGCCKVKFLHIRGIPVDELSNEPVVIEIEWQ